MTATGDTLPTATRVGDPGIRALYRLENRWQAWLDVEVALGYQGFSSLGRQTMSPAASLLLYRDGLSVFSADSGHGTDRQAKSVMFFHALCGLLE